MPALINVHTCVMEETLKMKKLMTVAGLAAFVHGIIPACCETTASSEVLAMNEEIRARRALLNEPSLV